MKQEDVQKYWAEKEQRFNEKLVIKSVAFYEQGHPHFPERAFGLLYLMSESLNFENFEKKTMLPFVSPEYKQVELRVPLNDIRVCRVIDGEKLKLTRLWKVFAKNEPDRIEVDCYIQGTVKTLVFSGLMELHNWRENFEKLLADRE